MAGYTFEVEGMTCGACVGRVERILSAVDGAGKAVANLAQNSATVEGGAAPALAAALEQAGFAARETHLTLAIEGMTCASCVGRVERGLAALPGVTQAQVNLATSSAEVRFLAGAVTPDALISAVAALGYVAKPQAQLGAEDHKTAEMDDLRRQLLTALVLALPVFVLEMGGHLVPAFHHFILRTIGTQTNWLIQFVLTTAVLIGPGRVFYRRGWASLRHGAPDMNALVMIGTAAAYVFSVIATFAPGLLPSAARAVYFEAAAVIVTLILLGRWMEARAKGRTGAAIARLVGLAPKTAQVERDGVVQDLPLDQVLVGDILHLRPGEKVAVDGEVLTGDSYVDESMISGEPAPVAKTVGAAITGGTVNGTGALTYRALRVGADTMLAQIIRMVGEAQGARLPVQDLVNKITGWFVPAVLLAAALTVLAWVVFGPAPALTHALVAGVAVLIIACPCAMGLAVPVSIMVGTGRAAELGVLFRKGDALQGLQSVQVIALDKTGTLTAGRPEMTDMVLAKGFDRNVVLARIAAVEAKSEHPIAQAILRAARDKGLEVPPAFDFASHTGFGIAAQVAGQRMLVGSARFMAREGVDLGDLGKAGDTLAANGKTPLFAAMAGRIAAVIGVADPVKPGTPEAIAALKAMGLRVVMISGDTKATARVIGGELGITEVVAEVLPEGKVEALAALRADGARLAFVGDGINDAPALASADVGIAIGTGTDVAIEAADVVLISGDLRGVVSALTVSHATMRNIKQNLFWAFGYNAALIPVAAGVLYPLWAVQLSPMLAAGAMAMSSVFVLSNALRLRWVSGGMA
ncbi:copper-translocating P-type ATPase [Pseudorhodobacter sp. E13]|uniref:heavy metal translocating P-type ATPase n=1 Tax=Pseudorhodobacter sp. E13 TaxID=2487931 RepID=UPI000F8CAC21|nr:heavy metal translocating P-type ATPase [Pseudorhodobacter sp. E13]RUS58654.1 copper-translocating P-type ATPase [Pseudorhodobacter sp. E13]